MTRTKKALSIGERLQELRTDYQPKMSQSQLAGLMKVSRETINHWENNEREIKANQVLKLAELFGVTCDYILRGVSSENVEIYNQTGLVERAISELHKQTGLKDEALNQLEIINNERFRGLFTKPISNIDLFNYMLSNKNFMEQFPNLLLEYFKEMLEDDDFTEQTGQHQNRKETKFAKFSLADLMEQLADECYTDFFYPIARGKKRKS